uniref:Uncharacterized protein n=1 Tax=Labrus bergylta TaxID=56723 RepID=A0A3Q3FPX6_9LABR
MVSGELILQFQLLKVQSSSLFWNSDLDVCVSCSSCKQYPKTPSCNTCKTPKAQNVTFILKKFFYFTVMGNNTNDLSLLCTEPIEETAGPLYQA